MKAKEKEKCYLCLFKKKKSLIYLSIAVLPNYQILFFRQVRLKQELLSISLSHTTNIIEQFSHHTIISKSLKQGKKLKFLIIIVSFVPYLLWYYLCMHEFFSVLIKFSLPQYFEYWIHT